MRMYEFLLVKSHSYVIEPMLRLTIFRVIKNDTLKMGYKTAYKIKRSEGFVKILLNMQFSTVYLHLLLQKRCRFLLHPPLSL